MSLSKLSIPQLEGFGYGLSIRIGNDRVWIDNDRISLILSGCIDWNWWSGH